MDRILVLPGDGIGPEVTREACRVLEVAAERHGRKLVFEEGLIGGASIDAHGTPLADDVVALARECGAVLLGAVGGPKWDDMPVDTRPERGLLRIRKELGLFANLRPATVFPALVGASTLRPEVVDGIDLLVVRELTGGIYFGEPRGRALVEGRREARNTMVYDESEVARIARTAFDAARGRRRHVTHVHKANVLEVSQLWCEVVDEVAGEYPDVELQHQLVDSCAMLLVREPARFDVIVTGNLFGDILSDEAAMITGSLGMLPSASLGEGGVGLYEPVHGSPPCSWSTPCPPPRLPPTYAGPCRRCWPPGIARRISFCPERTRRPWAAEPWAIASWRRWARHERQPDAGGGRHWGHRRPGQ
jgi:3-isopropylmalate dehydrogenase